MTTAFFSKVLNHYNQNLPFVLFRKPNSNIIKAILQQNSNLYQIVNYNEKGFVFTSFDKKQLVLIPEEESEILETTFENDSNKTSFSVQLNIQDWAKNEFQNLVSKGIEAINNGAFKKVVLSRKEEITINNFNFITVFQDLLHLHSTALVYCFYHPKIGFWTGASPEQLLQITKKSFKTTALAGTQKANNNSEIIWKQKEKDEQQFVTDFIIKRLKKVASPVIISKPYSIKANTIWHIKTDISGVLNSKFTFKKVINLLHPTPAVCGLPKKKARDFIIKNENYDRAFYTGFLGELNTNETSDLYVNLRCMQILEKKAILYIGCGITKDSIPEKEWEESVNKSMTMKRVLEVE